MKKLAIAASAASLAVAAMPVVGVFAADPTAQPYTYTDTLQVTIEKACAFGYSNTNGAAATNPGDINVTGVQRTDGTTGAWGSAAADNTYATLSRTMVNGTEDPALGTTKLGIYCNNVNGYSITSAFVKPGATAGTFVTNEGGALLGATSGKNIPAGTTIEANNETASVWSYKVATQTGNIGVVQSGFSAWSGTTGVIVSAPTTSGASKMTENSGDYFTITYGVRVDQTQPADTYTGGISYTLAQL